MRNDHQDNRYEQLYEGLLQRADWLHELNKKQVKYGSIALLALPVVLFLVRWLTDSDKVVFLLLWVLGIVVISAYLIGVEYLDHILRKSVEDLTDREAEFDGLIPAPPRPHLQGKIIRKVTRLQEREEMRDHLKLYGIEDADMEQVIGDAPQTDEIELDIEIDAPEVPEVKIEIDVEGPESVPGTSGEDGDVR